MIAQLLALGEVGAWIVAPLGQVATPLPGSLRPLDFLLRDPIASAGARGFFRAEAGERLLVAPGASPLAGILVVGYGDPQLGWAQAMERAVEALPETLPGGGDVVAVLPPAPTRDRIPLAWASAADRFIPRLKARMPGIKRWVWLDLLEDAV